MYVEKSYNKNGKSYITKRLRNAIQHYGMNNCLFIYLFIKKQLVIHDKALM